MRKIFGWILILEVVLVGIMWWLFRMDEKLPESKQIVSDQIAPTARILEKADRGDPVFSKDGYVFAYLKWRNKNEEVRQIKLVVQPQGSGWEVGDSIEDTQKVLGEVGSRDVWDSDLAWSSDATNLAVRVGNQVWLARFHLEEKVLIGDTLSQLDTTTSAKFIWFDKNMLYGADEEKIFEIWPEYKLIRELEEVPLELVKVRDGVIAYLVDKPAEGYGTRDLVILNNGSERRYRVPSQGMDWFGNIHLSPNLDKACMETSASGYSGYLIFNLGAKMPEVTGQQYSRCLEWNDNSTVMLLENSYYNQWHKQIYAYDVETKMRKLITNFVENQKEPGSFPVYW